jgi:RNA polymerase sigma-70 factor (ECF subfamily)
VELDMGTAFVISEVSHVGGWAIPLRMAPSVRTQVEFRLDNDRLCALIEAVAATRDRKAFAELFTYLAPRLKAFGLRQGATPAAAEELTQEAMIALWRKADTFERKRATALSWVFTIVRNKRIDMFRRESRSEVPLDEAADQPSDGIPADSAFALAQAGRIVRQALAHLPTEQVEVLEKAFFEDKPHTVIAEELNLPLGTVKSRVRLGLSRLRNALPEDQL